MSMNNSGVRAYQELRQKLPILKQVLQTDHIIVFGSQARGDANEDSDLDVIIVSKRFAEEKVPDRGRLLFPLIWRDKSVDAICMTPEEFEKVRNWPGLVNTACEEGIWL
jgi:predicted nucleotidyltransferase